MKLLEIGILIIFLGIVFVVIGALTQAKTSDTKIAVGGFLGPIPFGFANDKIMLWVVMGLSAAIVLFTILFRFLK